MKLKDSLDRRFRFAPPQPKGEPVRLQPRDLDLFEAIHRHGPLPTHYLYELTKAGALVNFKQRLTKLYNGTENGRPYLIRPPQQFNSFAARYQPLIYDLAPAAETVLSEHGRLPNLPERTDPFLHRFMGACVSASIQLAAPRYIHKGEIFNHAKCPDTTRNAANPLALPLYQGKLVPDDLFGIDYGGKYRFFAVEIDRKTERLTTTNMEQRELHKSVYGQKVLSYIDILRNGIYKKYWGIPNLIVLTVTTNQTHMQNMIAYLKSLNEPKLQGHFLFQAKPDFGSAWRVPEIMRDLFREWKSPDGKFDISKA